jgi:predicted metal-dependent peptidase
VTPRQLLGQARVHTFEYVPYLASYIYSLREQETPGIGTAAVDADGNLYWDPKFITEIGKEQTAYLVAHEALHLIFDHLSRAREIIGENPSGFQRYACNVAGDLVIEQTLHMMRHMRPEGAIHLGCEIKSWGIRLDFPENKSMQTYYRLIMENLKDNNSQGDGSDNDDQQGDGSASGGSGPDADSGEPHGSGNGDGDASPDDDGTKADGGEASPSGGAGSPSAVQGKEPQKPGAPGTGGSCADGQPRDYEIESDGSWSTYGEDMAAAKAEDAIAEYERSNPGSVPGNIKEALRCKLRPQPDPFDQLRSAVCSSVASPVGGRDFSHRRRSRKQPPDENVPLLHGRITMQPHAVVIVDTSASMLDRETKAKALSVIAQGLRKLSRVKVFCADTHVQSHALVSGTDRFQWSGGGGTDMSTAIAEVDRSDHPDSIIVVTDAETTWHGRKPHARVVVAYTGRVGSASHHNIPKWCRVIPLEDRNA